MKNYLSTMFELPDVVVDRDQAALSLNIQISVSACQKRENFISDDRICVPENIRCVPKSHLVKIVREIVRALSLRTNLFVQNTACA